MRLEPRFARVAREQYRDGEEYPMEVREERSSKSHAFYMASVTSAWKNLNGETAEILSTPTHLRGWALVETGWHDQHIVEAPDKQSAMKWAIFARKISSHEGYSEIKVLKQDGRWFIRIRTPRSQSRAAMNKEDFKASSNDVLNVLAGTIEVKRHDLDKAGREEAA